MTTKTATQLLHVTSSAVKPFKLNFVAPSPTYHKVGYQSNLKVIHHDIITRKRFIHFFQNNVKKKGLFYHVDLSLEYLSANISVHIN